MNSEEILRKEFEDLKHNPLSINGYTIELFNQYNIYEWKITLLGAKDTPYANGIFFIKLQFPHDYPHSRPEIYFLTPIYHMNVLRSNGKVGVNFIYEWNPNRSVREILTKLYSIFYLVNPHSPYQREMADEYMKDKNLYEFNAKKYTDQYAKFKSFEDNENNNENIRLNFIINGERNKYCIDCRSNMGIRELIDRIQGMINTKLNWPLLIYEGKKLDENLTLSKNGLKNDSLVTIIHDVHY
jgi:ubiquitin-conjugating enzyme E2 D/E